MGLNSDPIVMAVKRLPLPISKNNEVRGSEVKVFFMDTDGIFFFLRHVNLLLMSLTISIGDPLYNTLGERGQ